MNPSAIVRNHPFLIVARTFSAMISLIFIIFSFAPDDIDIFTLFGSYGIFAALGVVPVAALLAGFFFLDWRMKALYIYTDKLSYAKGVINKNVTTVKYEKIATVDIHRPFFYRIIGFSKLKIDSNTVAATAVGKSEIVLVLAKNAAEQLKVDLLGFLQNSVSDNTGEGAVPAPANNPPIYWLQSGKVVIMSVLSVLIGFFIVTPYLASASIVFYNEITEVLPYAAIVLIFAGILLFFLGISAISIALMYYKFTLCKTPKNLFLSYGLLSTKNITVPLNKINGVKLSQNLFQRFANLYSVSVLSAGYGDEQNELNSVIAPSATSEQAQFLINEIYGNMNEQKFDFVRPNGKAMLLYFLPTVFFILVTGIMFFLSLNIIFGIIGLITVMFVLIAGLLQYYNSCIGFSSKFYRIDKGGIFRKTIILPRTRLQSTAMRSGPLQRICGQGTLSVYTFASMSAGSSGANLKKSSPSPINGIIKIRHLNRSLIDEISQR